MDILARTPPGLRHAGRWLELPMAARVGMHAVKRSAVRGIAVKGIVAKSALQIFRFALRLRCTFVESEKCGASAPLQMLSAASIAAFKKLHATCLCRRCVDWKKIGQENSGKKMRDDVSALTIKILHHIARRDGRK